ncbi:MAG: methylated-DNA--[protein]-cysteine S-methyltransferase [Bryobacteraceae bacterium]
MSNWTLVEGNLADGLPMRLFIGERDGKIAAASLCDDQHPRTEDEFLWRFGSPHSRGSSPELQEAARQAAEYFLGTRTTFDLPLRLRGTDFQCRVWEQLRLIPFGSTISYGDLAEQIDAPAAFRAVGNANGRNCLPVFIPCHRVLAAGGKLGGFTGGIGLKKRLLAHESAVLNRPLSL